MPTFNLTFKACRRIGRNQNLTKEGNKPKKFDVPRAAGRAKLEWLEKSNVNEKAH